MSGWTLLPPSDVGVSTAKGRRYFWLLPTLLPPKLSFASVSSQSHSLLRRQGPRRPCRVSVGGQPLAAPPQPGHVWGCRSCWVLRYSQCERSAPTPPNDGTYCAPLLSEQSGGGWLVKCRPCKTYLKSLSHRWAYGWYKNASIVI